MRLVIQRAAQASVSVDGKPVSEIGKGFPILILIDAEGNVSETVGLEGLEIINEMRHRDYRKGREIFRRYKKALEDHEPLKKSERDYYFEIVRMVDGIGLIVQSTQQPFINSLKQRKG